MAGDEVISNPDNDKLTIDYLANAFEDLETLHRNLMSKHAKLEKKFEKLMMIHNDLIVEHNDLIDVHDKLQEDLNSHTSSSSHKSVIVPINRDEIDEMKSKMNVLSSTLSKCAIDHVKLESLFKKKNTHSSHVSHSSHAHHGNHSHHAHIYSNIYVCSFCGRKGHVSKFCYDRLNVTNNQVWVKRTNNPGPTKIWVPKLPHSHVDIGTSQVQPL
jgi:hypothetical protein